MADNPQKDQGTTPRKWAGKYDSPEEMEKGMMNLIPAFDEIKQEAARSQKAASQAMEAAQLYQEQVHTLTEAFTKMNQTPEEPLDDRGVQAYIDRRMQGVEKSIQALPGLIDSRLKALVEPLAAVQNAKLAYMGQNSDFDEGAVQKFLAVNPSINKVYQRLLSDPDSAGDAFKYVHDMYRGSVQKPGPDLDRKREAGSPRPSAGPPAEIPGSDESNAQQVREMGLRAQRSFSTDDELSFAKAYFNGSKVAAEIEAMKPDWARD